MSDIVSLVPMKECQSYQKCSAPLCPLDTGLQNRFWFADESVCNSRKYGNHRWIRKQRSIVKRQTKRWLDKAISYQDLYDASRPRCLSQERIEQLVQSLKKARQTKAIKAA
jgi:hypothetical protein